MAGREDSTGGDTVETERETVRGGEGGEETSPGIIKDTEKNSLAFWKDVLKLSYLFKLWFSPKVGNGTTILFWQGHWIGIMELKLSFPNLFFFARNPNCSVKHFLEKAPFQSSFRHPMSSLASRELQQLRLLLQNVPLSPGQDSWTWKWNSNGIFRVKSCYNFLVHGGVISRFGKGFWNIPMPEKAKLFYWLCYHDKVLTRENLIKRGINIIGSCPLCGEHGESMNHLMMQCNYSIAYWHLILSNLNIPELPSSFTEIWNRWRHSHFVKTKFPTLECLLITAIWCIWKERNLRAFHFQANMPPLSAKKAVNTFVSWVSVISHPINVRLLISQLSQAPV
ncbi:uncharacterized protein [Elaeis guineensis]|uniref:uncharacterized protein n=1 Tax=Elaeis guineensis var. tenera TaxID=51953 RepID=UPI003C6D309C